MVADVIVEEGSNEEIGMVITRMSPDFALLTRGLERRFQPFRTQAGFQPRIIVSQIGRAHV